MSSKHKLNRRIRAKIQEPNKVILTLEMVGLLVIFAFGVTRFIGSLRGNGR